MAAVAQIRYALWGARNLCQEPRKVRGNGVYTFIKALLKNAPLHADLVAQQLR